MLDVFMYLVPLNLRVHGHARGHMISTDVTTGMVLCPWLVGVGTGVSFSSLVYLKDISAHLLPSIPWMYNKLAAKQLLSPFQIIITLIFLTPSLIASLIQILMQISLLFVVVCFINNFFKK